MAAPPPDLAPLRASSAADPTLLDELARMTPEERLRWNDRMAATVMELRHAFAATRPDHAPRAARGERD